MSKSLEFLAHLGEAPLTNAQLQEASGLERVAVSNRLTALQSLKLAKRTADGWVKVVKANGHAQPVNDSPAPPPKAKRSKKRAAKRVARAPREEEPMFSFFLDADLDVQIAPSDGEGEATIIPREDAVRLYDFLHSVHSVLRLA